MAKLSLITPLFNRVHLVEETWQSVRAQTMRDWEWIMVDDGSTDGSYELIEQISRSDRRVKIFHRPEQLTKGPSSCRNFGQKMSSGAYLIFLDSDDLLAPHCIEERSLFMQQNSHLDFAVFPMQCFNKVPGDDDRLFNVFLTGREQYLEYFLTDRPPWQTMCPVWKRTSFSRLGGFNESYTCMEDPDLHVKALLSGYDFEVVDVQPDCYYRASYEENQENHRFWQNSIEGRGKFLIDMYDHINDKIKGEPEKKRYVTYLSQFYIALLKGFMLSRINDYQKEFTGLKNWVREKKLISRYRMLLVDLAQNVYSSKNWILEIIPIRGLIYRML